MSFNLKSYALDALDRGVDCLRSRQHEDGTWSDFDMGIGGASDDWVTAYVCCAIGHIDSNVTRDLIALACQAIAARQGADGGWGYNGRMLPDADTTSFAIRAVLENQGQCDQSSARAFLLKHQDRVNGGFMTYSAPNDLRDLYKKFGREVGSFAGWCSSHVEVTASTLESLSILEAVELEPIESALTFLENSRDLDGLWRGYWATDAYYPTYRSVVALGRFRPASDPHFAHAAKGLTGKQHTDGAWRPAASVLGCPFRTALAAETLLMVGGNVDAAIAATQWLVDRQQEDGRWATRTPFLRIPPPNVLSPDQYQGWGSNGGGRGAKYVDDRGILTTATVLSYLARYLQESI